MDPDPHPPENTMPPKKRAQKEMSKDELAAQNEKKRQLVEANAGVKTRDSSEDESDDSKEIVPEQAQETKVPLPDSDLERQQRIGVWTVHSVLGHTAPIPCSSDNP